MQRVDQAQCGTERGHGETRFRRRGRRRPRARTRSRSWSARPKERCSRRTCPSRPPRATGTPILLGTINQDTGAAGAFPELTLADKVAVDFINTELNGVDGHPIELVTCNTNFSPDLSQSCAQEMVSKKVDAVIGGIDVWGTGIQTLENNGIPYVGGIPVSFESARSKVSHQFSGGTWGAALGMGQYAIEKLHAKKIAIIYADFGPITDSAKLAETVLERHGADVTLIGVSADQRRHGDRAQRSRTVQARRRAGADRRHRLQADDAHRAADRPRRCRSCTPGPARRPRS